METITTKVRDGEITIPTIGKIKSADSGIMIYKIISYAWGHYIKYIYPNSFYIDEFPLVFYSKDRFENTVAITKEEWNKTIKEMAERLLEDNLIK